MPVLLIGVVLYTPQLRERAQEIVRPYAEQAAGLAGELLNTVPKPDGLSLEKPEAADPSSGVFSA